MFLLTKMHTSTLRVFCLAVVGQEKHRRTWSFYDKQQQDLGLCKIFLLLNFRLPLKRLGKKVLSSSDSACLSLWHVGLSQNYFLWKYVSLCRSNFLFSVTSLELHSFHWPVQIVTIPCRSQELLPFFSVMYFFLPPFSTNYSSILSHLILPSISWSTSQSHCSQFHI